MLTTGLLPADGGQPDARVTSTSRGGSAGATMLLSSGGVHCGRSRFIWSLSASLCLVLIPCALGRAFHFEEAHQVALDTDGHSMLLGRAERRSSTRDVRRSQPFPAGAVFSEFGGFPAGSNQTVELLRFITAYGTGLEAFVDVTPYLPMLSAVASASSQQESQELQFYAYISTWVGNGTGNPVLFINSSNHTCGAATHFDGNGWTLSADLVGWESSAQSAPPRPFASVTLATGVFGSSYPVGGVKMLKGNITSDGAAIVLSDDFDLESAAGAAIYSCPGGEDAELRKAAAFGYLAQQARFQHGQSGKENVETLAETVFEMYAGERLSTAKVLSSRPDNRTALVSYNPKEASVKVGTAVYFDPEEVYTDMKVIGGYALIPYPLEPAGHVEAVHENNTLKVILNASCLSKAKGLPTILLPRKHGALNALKVLINKTVGLAATVEQPAYSQGPWFVTPHQNGTGEEGSYHLKAALALATLAPHGLFIGTKPGLVAKQQSEERVCMVPYSRHGDVFKRSFQLPSVTGGGSIIMQFVVTGHGWALTSEQCGEYCHAVYELSLNGVKALNITQWRNDCHNNPIGPRQRGTWDESRNGWCPGTVEPGLFVDVTNWVQPGYNTFQLKLLVWSNITGSYTPYVDYGGFALGDLASVVVGTTMFAYDASAVSAIRSQTTAYTAAEAAVRDGSSMPSALEVPVSPYVARPIVLLRQTASRKEHGKAHLVEVPAAEDVDVNLTASEDIGASNRFNFEASAPWYLHNSTANGLPGHGLDGALRVPIFKSELVQGNRQTVQARISMSAAGISDWSRISSMGLHLRLSKPPGDLQIDHWDRLGSVGLLLKDKELVHSPSLHMEKAEKPGGTKRWPIEKPQ